MSIQQTGIRTASLAFAHGQAQLAQLNSQGTASAQARIGIQKDGKLVLYSGRSYLLHPQQTRRAAQFLQTLQPQEAARSPRLGDLVDRSRAALQQQHAVLRSLLLGAHLAPSNLLKRPSDSTSLRPLTTLPVRPSSSEPPLIARQQATPGWVQRLQHAAARIRAEKTDAPVRQPSPLEQAKLKFLGRLAQDEALAHSVRDSLERFGADLAQASAAEKAGLFRVPLAATTLTTMYQALAQKQRTTASLDLHQRAHLIKTLLAPFKLPDRVLSQLPANAVYARQRQSLEVLLSPTPTPAARATHAAVAQAFHALAQAELQASPSTAQPFNKASIGAQAILFDIVSLPLDPTLAAKTSAVLACWRKAQA